MSMKGKRDYFFMDEYKNVKIKEWGFVKIKEWNGICNA